MKMRWIAAVAMLALAAPAIADGDKNAVEQGRAGGKSKEKPGKAPVTVSPNDAPEPASWYTDGMAAIRAKNPGKAVALMNPVLADFDKRYADEKRHIYCAINAAQSAAYKEDATKASQDYVTIEPGWCRAQYVRAYALIDLDKLDDALTAFQHLTDLAPRNSRYLSELGYVLSAKRKYADALAMYQRSLAAVGLSPDNEDTEKCAAYRGMGFNLARLGRITEAEKAYRACLAIDPENKDVQDAIDGLADATKETA